MNTDDVTNTGVPPADGGEPKADIESPAERAAREAERIAELRSRLYARGETQKQTIRHALPKHEIPDVIPTPRVPNPDEREELHTEAAPAEVSPIAATTVSYNDTMITKRKQKSFRTKIIAFGSLFFIAALGMSAFLMLRGGNTISGENITITVNGPIAVGGGDEVPVTVTVANQNAVAIESATLIVEYPRGTQSVTESGKEVGIERIPLDTIGTGELINIPLRARVFGEENEEKEIKVSIDYRIQGSNATFHKDAAPLRFKVSTSPVIMTFDTVKSVSSGQDVDVTLTVQSNSPTPLTDILVKVMYPAGFDFNQATPETLSGEDVWKFAELKPNEKRVITITGLVTGYEDEILQFGALVGVSNEDDLNTIASQLSTGHTEIVIEQPFLDTAISINGSNKDVVVINNNNYASVEVTFTNKLDFPIFDGKVQIVLEGNALDEFEVNAGKGFYDSTKNTITWDGVIENGLKEIASGSSVHLTFSLSPIEGIERTPEMKLRVTLSGQRISEDDVPQLLVGTGSRTLRVESEPTVEGEAFYTKGPFTNTGPIPPVAEKVTQYTYILKVKAGSNDLTGAEMTAVVPIYVSWLDLVSAGETVTYNSQTRTMKWNIGNIEANSEKTVSIQVSFLPSLSQVGASPTLLEMQRFKATDRFTSTVIRVDHSAIITNLFGEVDEKFHDGMVQLREE